MAATIKEFLFVAAILTTISSTIREAAAGASVDGGGHEEVSDTLYACGRRSTVRDALLGLVRRVVPRTRRTRAPPDETVAPSKWRSPRWSDCACKSCVAWRCGEEGGGRLHVVVKEPAPKGNVPLFCLVPGHARNTYMIQYALRF